MKKLVFLSLLVYFFAFPSFAQVNWKHQFKSSLTEHEKDRKTLHDIAILVNVVTNEKDENKINLSSVQKKLTILSASDYFIFNKKDSLQKMFVADSLILLYDSLANKPNNATLFAEDFKAIETLDSLNFLKHYNFGIITGTSVDALPIRPGRTGRMEYYLANIKKMIESNPSIFKGKGLTFAEYQKMEAEENFKLESKAIEFRLNFISYLQTTYNL